MFGFTNKGRRVLRMDEIKAKAPSVFAEGPREGVSSRYSFIPTTQAVTALTNAGWLPVHAAQSRARTEDGREYARHVLRFTRETTLNAQALAVGDSVPELILLNSHDGTSSYDLSLGMFRLVCSNGLMVANGSLAHFRIRHVGYTDAKVVDAAARVLADAPKAIEAVDAMKRLQLVSGEREALANAALGLRWDSPQHAPVTAAQLLRPRRSADTSADLWSTFNVIQENIVKGGLNGVHASGRRARTRGVNSVNEDTRLNRALWTLAESIRAIRAGESAPVTEREVTPILVD